MKLCAVLLTGAADVPLAELDGKTPLAAARLPAIHALAGEGRVGGVRTIPDGLGSSPETAYRSLLGRPPEGPTPSAGALLAIALGVEVGPRERAFRCDFVNLYSGAVVDPTAGRLGDTEAGILIEALGESYGSATVRFLPGHGWRALLLVGEGQADGAKTESPSSFLGEPCSSHAPRGAGAELLRSIADRAAETLPEHEINMVRVDLGENPANGIWIWGGGRPDGAGAVSEGPPSTACAAVGRHPSFLGMARTEGWRTVRVAGDDPASLREAALEALETSDLVILEVGAALEMSRLGEVAEKIRYLEAVDEEIVAPIGKKLVTGSDGRLLVVPTHVADSAGRRECRGLVPFLLAGHEVASYGEHAFSEEGAEHADLKVERGSGLLAYARGAGS